MSHHGGLRRNPDSPPECLEGARLCHPRIANGPSGRRLRHGADCPVHPLEPINVREYARGRTFASWPPRGRTA